MSERRIYREKAHKYDKNSNPDNLRNLRKFTLTKNGRLSTVTDETISLQYSIHSKKKKHKVKCVTAS